MTREHKMQAPDDGGEGQPPLENTDFREEDEAFRAAVRKTAYFLWEQDGRPHGRHDEYYLRALARHRREREYDQWLEDGPDGDEP
ncbi:MAG TPA: DUF2934 domain-containing protein [Devosia sp.]|uniref:DUF2934 domain-containing protein n=1 Tax=Devosia sp. TaxID=1871048 RepID=UPI002DDCBB67|nr:DUF2934 domain-containing protein [Devosia sp.]HEV2514050.1 DUF2934 domain-containing protein [Devosia sp.]